MRNEFKQLIFVLAFGLVALVAQNINFSTLVGAPNQAFTFFQFIGPLPSAFLGIYSGIAAILLAQLANYALLGKTIDFVAAWRLLPMLFAAYYFGRGIKAVRAIIPLACMALFIMHPVGGQAWVYSLYWLIPPLALFFEKNLLARSLGSTFTAHAIGSTIFLYTVPMAPAAWLALIPVVAFERGLFTLGIAGSYVAFTTFLTAVEKILPRGVLKLEKQYSFAPLKIR